MRCWHGYLSGSRFKWSVYDLADVTATPSSLASLKSRMVLPLWYQLTQVVLENRPLNGYSNCCICLQQMVQCEVWRHLMCRPVRTERTMSHYHMTVWVSLIGRRVMWLSGCSELACSDTLNCLSHSTWMDKCYCSWTVLKWRYKIYETYEDVRTKVWLSRTFLWLVLCACVDTLKSID